MDDPVTQAIAKLDSGMKYVALRPPDEITLDGTFAIDDLAAFVDAWRGSAVTP